MEILIALVSLAGSILSIILFFKLWKACDDINSINNKFKRDTTAFSYLLADDFDKGIEALKIEYVEKLIAQYYWFNGIKNVMDEYLPTFKRLGVDLPEHLKDEQKLKEHVKSLIGEIQK